MANTPVNLEGRLKSVGQGLKRTVGIPLDSWQLWDRLSGDNLLYIDPVTDVSSVYTVDNIQEMATKIAQSTIAYTGFTFTVVDASGTPYTYTVSGDNSVLSSRYAVNAVSLLNADVDSISGIVDNLSTNVFATISDVSDDLIGVLGTVSSDLTSDLETVSSNLLSTIETVSSNLTSTIETVSGDLIDTLETVSSALTSDLEAVSSDLLSSIETVSSTLTDNLEAVSSKFADITDDLELAILAGTDTGPVPLYDWDDIHPQEALVSPEVAGGKACDSATLIFTVDVADDYIAPAYGGDNQNIVKLGQWQRGSTLIYCNSQGGINAVMDSVNANIRHALTPGRHIIVKCYEKISDTQTISKTVIDDAELISQTLTGMNGLSIEVGNTSGTDYTKLHIETKVYRGLALSEEEMRDTIKNGGNLQLQLAQYTKSTLDKTRATEEELSSQISSKVDILNGHFKDVTNIVQRSIPTEIPSGEYLPNPFNINNTGENWGSQGWYDSLSSIGLSVEEPVVIKEITFYRRNGNTPNGHIPIWLKVLKYDYDLSAWVKHYQSTNSIIQDEYTQAGEPMTWTMKHVPGLPYFTTHDKVIFGATSDPDAPDIETVSFGQKATVVGIERGDHNVIGTSPVIKNATPETLNLVGDDITIALTVKADRFVSTEVSGEVPILDDLSALSSEIRLYTNFNVKENIKDLSAETTEALAELAEIVDGEIEIIDNSITALTETITDLSGNFVKLKPWETEIYLDSSHTLTGGGFDFNNLFSIKDSIPYKSEVTFGAIQFPFDDAELSGPAYDAKGVNKSALKLAVYPYDGDYSSRPLADITLQTLNEQDTSAGAELSSTVQTASLNMLTEGVANLRLITYKAHGPRFWTSINSEASATYLYVDADYVGPSGGKVQAKIGMSDSYIALYGDVKVTTDKLSSEFTDSQEFVTKAYVDGHTPGIGPLDYLPLSGGTVTGNIIAPAISANSVSSTNDIVEAGTLLRNKYQAILSAGDGISISSNVVTNTNPVIKFRYMDSAR